MAMLQRQEVQEPEVQLYIVAHLDSVDFSIASSYLEQVSCISQEALPTLGIDLMIGKFVSS